MSNKERGFWTVLFRMASCMFLFFNPSDSSLATNWFVWNWVYILLRHSGATRAFFHFLSLAFSQVSVELVVYVCLSLSLALRFNSFDKIFFTTLRFCHTSRSLSVSSLGCIDIFLLGRIYFFDQMLDLSFFGGGSWLDFFCFLDMNEPPLRNAAPKDSEVSIPGPMNGVPLATETYDVMKSQKRNCQGDLFLSFFLSWRRLLKEIFFFWRVFVTNLSWKE